MILATIGQRVPPEQVRGLVDFALTVLERERPTLLTTDLRDGWGSACGQAALECGLPYVAFIADKGYRRHPTPVVRKTFFHVLQGALGVVEDGTEGMVKHADRLLILSDGTSDPASTRAIELASANGKPVTELWPDWLRYATSPALHTAQDL